MSEYGDTASNPAYKTDPDTGDMFYTDPQTKTEYKLDRVKNEWVLKDSSVTASDSSAGDKEADDKQYDFDGKTYLHTDANGIKHKWDPEAKKWVKLDEEEEEESEESEEDDNTTDADRKARMFRKRKAQPGWGAQGQYSKDPETGAQLYYDAKDGMTYEWDTVKRAWFPRINEDFVAQYQMNYGFTKDGVAEPTKPAEEPTEEEKAKECAEKAQEAKKPKKEKPEW